jgi:hypothetical protein
VREDFDVIEGRVFAGVGQTFDTDLVVGAENE